MALTTISSADAQFNVEFFDRFNQKLNLCEKDRPILLKRDAGTLVLGVEKNRLVTVEQGSNFIARFFQWLFKGFSKIDTNPAKVKALVDLSKSIHCPGRHAREIACGFIADQAFTVSNFVRSGASTFYEGGKAWVANYGS